MIQTHGSVGTHWAHQKFAQNLINASRSRDLEGAAKEWSWHSLHEDPEWQHCQLCNKDIKVCVTIQNSQNGNHVVLGEDCYDKLLQFLRTGKVQTALPERSEYAKQLRSYWKEQTKVFKNRTVTGWLRDELAGGRVPGKAASIVYTITRLGFAPTTTDADLVIAFYKANRKFKLASLLKPEELNGFRHMKCLPAEITIDEMSRVRAIIARDKPLSEKFRLARKRLWLKSDLSRTLAELSRFRDKVEIVAGAGVVSAVTALEKVDECSRQIEALQDDTKNVDLDSWHLARKAAELSRDCRERYRWEVTQPETIFSVRTQFSRSYILIERDGRWQPRWDVERYVVKDLVSKTGLYTARVVETLSGTLVRLEQKLEDMDRFIPIDFSIRSKKNPELFVGEWNGKIVLPSKPIKVVGKHSVFLTNEEGRYYRAWIL